MLKQEITFPQTSAIKLEAHYFIIMVLEYHTASLNQEFQVG